MQYRMKNEDEDVSQIFIDMLEKDINEIQKKFNFPRKIIFSLKSIKLISRKQPHV